jgi:hypothetical protein
LQKEKFISKLKTSHEQQITWEFLSLRVQNVAQEIRQNGGILNRVRVFWARRGEKLANDGKHFEQLL